MKTHWLWIFPVAAALAGCAPTGYGAGPYDGGYGYGGYRYGGRPYYPPHGWSHGGGYGGGYGYPPPRPPRDPAYIGPPAQMEPPGAYYRDRPSSGGYAPVGRRQGPYAGASGSGDGGGAPRSRGIPFPPGQEGVVMDSASSSARPFSGPYGGVSGGASGAQ